MYSEVTKAAVGRSGIGKPKRLGLVLLMLSLMGWNASAQTGAPLLRINSAVHVGQMRSSELDSAGQRYITAAQDRTARIWNLESRRLVAVVRPPDDGPATGEMGPVSLSPDGKDAVVTFQGREANLFLHHNTGALRAALNLPGNIRSLAWSEDSRWLLVSTQRALVKVDRATLAMSTLREGSQAFDVRVRNGRVAFYSFKPDGNSVVVSTCWVDGRAPCNVVDEPKERFWHLYLTPDGSQIIYGNSVRDAATGAVIKRFSDTPQLVWDEHGQAYALQAEQLRRYNLNTMTVAELVADVPGYYYGGHLIGQHLLYVRRAGQERQLVRLDLTTRKTEPLIAFGLDLPAAGALNGFEIQALAERGIRFTPHAPSSSCTSMMDLRQIPALPSHLKSYKPGQCPNVLAMPDGGAVQSSSYTLRRFAADGKVLWAVKQVADISLGMALSNDGRWIGVRAEDGTVRLMSANHGTEALAVFEQGGKWVMSTPSGYYDTSPGGENLLGWQVNRGPREPADYFPVSRFRAQFYRPDVVERVLAAQSEAQALTQGALEDGRRQPTTAVDAVLPPTVAILSPGDGAKFSTSAVSLRFRLRTQGDSPVTAIRFRANGQPLPFTRGLGRAEHPSKPSAEGSEEEISLVLPTQDTELQVFAENRHGVSTPATVRLTWAGAPTSSTGVSALYKPKLYVLAVGVSSYANPDYNLGLAAKDATDIAAAFQHQKGRLFGDVQVKLLTDGQATKEEVLDGLEWLKREVTARDVGVLFLAGHGVNDNTGTYYFLPHNADTNRLMRTGVPQNDIKSTLNALAGKALFFVDTCHAGNALGTAKSRSTGAVTDGLVNELSSAENGVVVFAASTGRQLSQESSAWGNGAFTKAVIEGLGGRADFQNNGKITHKGLDYYVSERVKTLTKGAQSPVSISPAGISDFPIAALP